MVTIMTLCPKPGDAVIGSSGPYPGRYAGTVTQVVKASKAMTLVQIEGRDNKTGEMGLFWMFAGQLRRAEA